RISPIDDFALASRLSYFLWSAMPDDELFRQAERGTLHRNLEPQVKRMLSDPKATALVENFAGQWLQLRNLDPVMPDAKLSPDLTCQARQGGPGKHPRNTAATAAAQCAGIEGRQAICAQRDVASAHGATSRQS